MYFTGLLILCFFCCLDVVYPKVVEQSWNITWVLANPDGRLTRPVIGVNGVWPTPALNVTIGDRLLIHVHNHLANETLTLHWHGLYQNGTNNMDGPSFVTQCPIPPGLSYTYNFTIDQPGTYWYHAHDGGQYPDGLRGSLIVHDPKAPFKYDEELVLTFSDWYHDQVPPLIAHYLSVDLNPDGSEPVPYSALLNDGHGKVLSVQPEKTYFLRVISVAAFAQAYIWIEDHELEIVEVDGIYTEPTSVSALYLATAQRYGVLLKTKSNRAKNYAITAVMDTTRFDNVPAYLQDNATAYLEYNPSLPNLQADVVDGFDVIDEFDIIPLDHQLAFTGPPDQSFTLNLSFFTQDNQNRAGFNNVTYLSQKVPTLYTVESAGLAAQNATIYGVNTNSMVAQYGHLIEVVINNFDDGAHIMHLHGHAVQVVAKVSDVPAYGGNGTAMPYDGDTSGFPLYPMRRDTWILAPSGYTVIRFRAFNPGVWLLHCHMEWHVDAGLIATLIEAPAHIQSGQPIDPFMQEVCQFQGIPIAGNAAGNIHDYYDLDGAVVTPASNPQGALIPT